MAEFFTAVTPAITSLVEVIGTCFQAAVDNPILLLGLAGSVVGVGLGIFKGIKDAM